MNAEASEARKIAAPTRSSETPSRRSGVLVIAQSFMTGWAHNLVVRSVRMKPGAIAFTRIPLGPHSAARERVICCSPDLLTAYGITPRRGRALLRDVLLIWLP